MVAGRFDAAGGVGVKGRGACAFAGACAVLVSLGAGTPAARAGGLEYNGAGTRAAGRGGAFVARADDGMALQYNPANLALLSTAQLMLNLNVGLWNVCQRRTGDYASVGGGLNDTIFPMGWEERAFPEVCNDTPFSPGASLVQTVALGDRFGVAFGVLTPYAAGTVNFGAPNGTVAGGTLPSPARYTLIRQNLLQFFPSVGAGYRPTKWLAVGATLQWGITLIDFTNMGAAVPGEDPAGDIRTNLRVQDYFTPAFIVGATVSPIDSLEVSASFRHVDDVRGRGTLTLEAHPLDAPTERNVTGRIDGVRLVAPQTSVLSVGVRYGHPRYGSGFMNRDAERSLRRDVFDRMNHELFDVELDFVYEVNSRVDAFRVNLGENPMLEVPFAGGASAPLPTPLRLEHRWRDQWGLRLGGDLNVIPGKLALRLGVHYESNGVDPRYAQLDFVPGQRIGLHGGATLRLGRLDLSLAYLHIFQADIVTTNGDFRQIALGTGVVVNNGTISGSWDALSLGGTYHF
jgi:long-chain fatty acid transport protein